MGTCGSFRERPGPRYGYLEATLNLLHDELGLLRVLEKVLVELFAHDGGDNLTNFAIAKFGLGLAFVLRVRMLDGNDASQTFAAVVGREVGIFLIEEFELVSVLVDDTV
jgi:hypothetical protein